MGQCATPLNPIVTPYIEDFEANNGGWTTGGTASDWTWGTPNKPPYITTAGSGTKCWITGGLNGNSYNGGQLSWLKSPCFSFTAGSYPYVRFKVFWETELQYDGANFQYSLDNGVTWTRVGSVSDPVDCINAFWYTYTPVRYITPPAAGSDGWAGSITATPNSGSNGWKTAQHTMKYLAGKSQVIFRFVFASGTSFNNFAGFAIDSFVIKNAPPIGAQFNNTCVNNNTVQFNDNSSNCPNKFLWNFGDPASGVNNTSTLQNPVHTFSGPGTYTVNFTASDVNLNHSFGTASRPITILGLGNTVVTPITCAGENNGSIALNVTGPAGFYTYNWNTSPVSHSATIGPLAPATYTVNVIPPVNTLGITCPMDTSFTLVAPPPVSPPIVSVNQPGCTLTTGDITITNPTAGYTYSVDSGATFALSPVFTGLLPGVYQVVIKNNSGCKSVAVMVTINPAATQLPEPVTTVVQPNCISLTGTITVTNPTTGVTYSFNGGTTFGTAASSGPLVPNDYAVLVKNAAGCVSDTAFVTINAQPDSLDAPFISIQQTTCTVSTGIITVTAPATGVTYSFNGGASFIPAAVSPALPIGTYNVIVKDALGCLSFFTEAVINDPPPLLPAPTTTIVHPTCTVTTGTITVTNPAVGVTYSFNNGVTFQTGATSIQLIPGYYNVIIKDAAGCLSDTAFEQILPQPDSLPPPAVTITQPVCTSPTGTITVTSPATGYVYSFDNGVTFQAGATSAALLPGTYNVMVKSIPGNCLSYVTEAEILASPGGPAAPAVSVTQPTCATATGVITVTSPVSGVTYSFNNGATFQASATSAALLPNTYQVVVKDAGGCVSQPTAVTINAQPQTPSAPATTVVQPTCTVATGTITVTAPVSGVTYSFDNGASFGASATSASLPSATYQVIVKSAAGCTSVATSTLINAQPTTPAAPSITVAHPTCLSATGTITVTAPALAVGYSFDNGVTFQLSPTSAALPAATYQVIVKNAAGCISSATSGVINPQPPVPAAPVTTVVQPTCTVSTGTITVTNPSTGVTYSFDNGVTFQAAATSGALTANTYQVVVKNAAGCISTATPTLINGQLGIPATPVVNVVQPTCTITTGNITVTVPASGVTYSFDNGATFQASATSVALTANTYQVIVKNATGCLSVATPAVINNPPLIPSAPTVTVVQPTCTVTTGVITVTAPAAGVTYSFDNGLSFQPGASATLPAGNTYQIIVKNAAGCLSTATPAIINAQPLIPAVPVVTIVQPTCSISTGTITVNNTTTGDVYSFDNGVSFNAASTSPALGAGTYQVIIKNAAGCTGASLGATINNQPSTPATPTTTVIHPTCTVSTGTITVTLPISGVTYSFDNGVNFQAGATSPALVSNTYQVIVKNAAGCISLATPATINAQPAVPAAPVTAVVHPTCTVSTGTIQVTNPATGVTYSFDNGVSFQAGSVSASLSPNTYQVVVMNGVGCKSLPTATVINPQPLIPSTPTVTVMQPSCSTPTGVITVTSPATGVTYSFDNGTTFQAGASSVALLPNSYNVIVKNTAGCVSAATATVITAQPVSPAAPLIAVTQPTCTVSTGIITVTGPLTGVTYSFNNGINFQNSNVSASLSANTYQVIVKNAAGCLSSATPATINVQPLIPAAPLVSSPVIYCEGKPAVALSATGTGLTWYTSPTAVTGSSTAPVPATNIPGNTVYFVSQSNGTCEGPRAAITVTVNATPAAPVLLKDTVVYCQFSSAAQLSAIGTGTFCWLTNCIPGTCSPSVLPSTTAIGFTDYCVNQTIAGCVSPATVVTVRVINAPDLGADKTASVCFGGNVNLLPLYNTTGYNYVWTYKGYPFATPDSVAIPGTFTLIAKNAGGCADSADVVVTVLPKVMAYAGGDTTAIINTPTKLHASGGGPGGTYLWSAIPPTSNAVINSPFDQHPFVTLRDFEYTFEVLVANSLGCTDRDTMKIKVLKGPQYYVPTAFAPGGINNLFRPVPVGIPNLDFFRVYNRFGEQVYATSRFMDGWDGNYKGQPQPVGTYVWLLQGKDVNGNIIKMNGTVVLVR